MRLISVAALALAALVPSRARAALVTIPVDLSATGGGGRAPAVATDGDNYFVVWNDATDATVKGLRVNGRGTPIDDSPVVVADLCRPAAENACGVGDPAVAFDGTNYLAVWVGLREVPSEVGAYPSQIYGARIDRNGSLMGAPFAIGGPTYWASLMYGGELYRLKVAFDGARYVVTWGELWGGGGAIWRARVATDGTVLDSPAVYLGSFNVLYHSEITDYSIGVGDSGYLLAFCQHSDSGAVWNATPMASDWTVQPLPGAMVPSPPGAVPYLPPECLSEPPVVVFAAGSYHALYIAQYPVHSSPFEVQVWDQVISPEGRYARPISFLYGNEVGGSGELAAAYNGSNLIAVWDLWGSLMARRYLPDGTFVDAAAFTVSAADVPWLEWPYAGLVASSNGSSFFVVWAGHGVLIADDTMPPTVLVPPDLTIAAASPGGSKVTYGASAFDLFSGILGPSCTPPSGSVFPPGDTVVTCSATDAAGNVGGGTFHVRVFFAWAGVAPPVKPDGTSIFKLGRTVPVKFQLAGASAGIVDLVATLTIRKISDGVLGNVEEGISTSAADYGNRFRYDPASSQYIFNLSTRALTAGTYQARIDMKDAVERTVVFSLRQ